MTKEFNVVIEKDADGYFVASVPALRGCHTQAKSLDVLMKRIREAIALCLEIEDAPSQRVRGCPTGRRHHLSIFPALACGRSSVVKDFQLGVEPFCCVRLTSDF